MGDLADAQASRVGQAEEQAIGSGRDGVEQPLHLVATEDGGQGLGPALVGQAWQVVGPLQARTWYWYV